MKSIDQIQQAMLKTYEPRELSSLVEEALEVAKFYSAKAELAQAKAEKLKAQVARQTKMISDLENALFGKR